jgi:hypothetical protein
MIELKLSLHLTHWEELALEKLIVFYDIDGCLLDTQKPHINEVSVLCGAVPFFCPKKSTKAGGLSVSSPALIRN